ncbi:hypothetical protein ACSAHR_08910 (plasmid) [Pediococcus pentosaceus]|uniref:hypothetical protein n=1 Tax=Pediococcus pentosaceus TaxID=1255 RepID=UPI00403932E5
MTDCLAVVAGNFEPVEDKPLKGLVTGLLDKKGTGCSLAASVIMGYIAKGLAVWLGDEWWALPLKARAVHWCLTARWSLLIVGMVEDKYIYNAS